MTEEPLTEQETEQWRDLMFLYIRAIRPFISREEKKFIASMIRSFQRAPDTASKRQAMYVLIAYFKKEEIHLVKTLLVTLALVAGCSAPVQPSTPLQEEKAPVVPIACLDALRDAESLNETFIDTTDAWVRLLDTGDYQSASEDMESVRLRVRASARSFRENTDTCRKIAEGR